MTSAIHFPARLRSRAVAFLGVVAILLPLIAACGESKKSPTDAVIAEANAIAGRVREKVRQLEEQDKRDRPFNVEFSGAARGE